MTQRTMQTILQTHTSECGLACLAMISSSFGHEVSLYELRQKYKVSVKGLSLVELIRIGEELGLVARPVRIELEDIPQLAGPAILHWDLQHFVVLDPSARAAPWRKHARDNGAPTIRIVDPASGRRKLGLSEASEHFTGIAIEFAPSASFTKQSSARPAARLRDVIGSVHGLRAALAWIFGVALLLETLAVIAPLFSQVAIDEAMSGNDTDTVAVIAVCFVGLLLMQTATSALRSWMVVRLTQSVAVQWAGNVFSHLLELPLNYFELRHTGDIANRFRSVDNIRQLLTTRTIESIIDGILASVSLLIMFLYSPLLAAVSLGAMAIYALLRVFSYEPFRAFAAKSLTTQGKENTFFLETLRSILQIRLFGHTLERRIRWQNLFTDIQNLELQRSKLNILFTSSNTLLMGLENILVVWIAAGMIADPGAKQFSVGMLLAYMNFKYHFALRVSSLIDYLFEVRMLSVHVERLADIVLTPPEHTPDRAIAGLSLAALAPTIELRGVRFRYGDGEPWILDGVNLFLAAGENVALTGPSGAGKSTLMKLLLGVLQPTEGELLIGGVELRCLQLDELRASIGAVLQDDVLLSGSIAQNISFFCAEHDQSHVQACAILAQVHAEIAAMPMGYHSVIGDLGNGLSGGQRQRILLARALYKRPRFLILDEATSHLDVANERAVGAAIASIPLTRLIIAHRDETIRAADRTVHLSQGRIVASSEPLCVEVAA
jgi:ATP-binding cassette subfamily B protein RaxB